MANYNVDISIAIKNTSKLTAFNKQLEKSSQRAKELNQGLSEITRTAKSNFASLNNLSNALTEAQKNFNKTVLGTKASVLAARDLATAERMVNKELKERTALMNKFRFQGVLAWFVWMTVHLMLLVGFRNRVVVFVNWTWNYFKYNNGLRLIIRPYKKRKVEDHLNQQKSSIHLLAD